MDVERRGWTLDVLNVLRLLGKPEFSLAEVYASEKDLSRTHPTIDTFETRFVSSCRSFATLASLISLVLASTAFAEESSI
jgi:hypothetical protein